ncbi:Uncharacterised protein [Bordetella pertussis]|nr:Uncharacterised protein [Bordetella pertussis]CPJ96089.1 Uncharacterised protein [Bordetella pertussis]CPO65213.1 Uncharacterised protein [Bordetella pertussis]CRD79196.1 Uncharacterised protein [Bordetella pertussis]
MPGSRKAARAASHSAASAASGAPRSGLTPVQVAAAVSRKPTAMAPMKPHSISCACQMTPAMAPPSHCGAPIHSATDSAPQAAPTR